ncbi:MAG: DUF72 domain-containing protein [Thermoplasmata archaeon]
MGTGGWAYFSIPGMDSLQAYARAFNYVEVNTTFYQVPPFDMVKGWRHRVPQDFSFAVRCHRAITHAHGFDPTDLVLDVMERMVEITRVLKADALHLLTPPSFEFGSPQLENLNALLDSVSLEGTPIALEVRSCAGRDLPRPLRRLMEDREIVHCVDLSKEEPQVESSLLYTRLFGKGYHTVYQFSDEELEGMHTRGNSRDYRRALFTFHGVRMYSDAGRFLTYSRTGRFPTAQAPGQKKLP